MSREIQISEDEFTEIVVLRRSLQNDLVGSNTCAKVTLTVNDSECFFSLIAVVLTKLSLGPGW